MCVDWGVCGLWCVCACVLHVQVVMYVFAHGCEGQTLVLDVLLDCFSFCCFESLELTNLASLSGPRDLFAFAIPALMTGIIALDDLGFLCGGWRSDLGSSQL